MEILVIEEFGIQKINSSLSKYIDDGWSLFSDLKAVYHPSGTKYFCTLIKNKES